MSNTTPTAGKTKPAPKTQAKAGKTVPKAKGKAPAKLKPKALAKLKAPAKDKPEATKVNVPAKVEKPDGALPLDTQAKQINANLDKAKFHEDKANDFRLTAACYLADAKKRIEAGELGKVKFLSWCNDNIQRSRADIYKLVKVGNSPDAQKALEDLRGKAAESMKKTRAKKKAATPAAPTAPVASAPVATTAAPEPTFEPGKMPWTETETAAPVELDGKQSAPEASQIPVAPIEEPRQEDRNRLFEAAKAAFNAMTHDSDRRAFVAWVQLTLDNGNSQGKGDNLNLPGFLNRKKS